MSVRFVGSAALVALALAAASGHVGASASTPTPSAGGATAATRATTPTPTTGPERISSPTRPLGPRPITTSPTASPTATHGTSAGPPSPTGPPPSATSMPTPSTPGPPPSAPTAPPPPTGHPGVLHLTFDDGPDPHWTPAVLEVLAKHHARATFFELGRAAAAHPNLVQAVRDGGHLVGNHTLTHPNLTRLSPEQVSAQVVGAKERLGGPACFRPPYGAVNATVRSVAAAAGERVVLWDVDTRDWQLPGADAIVEQVVGGASDGTIVLMHDGGTDRSQTVAALDRLLTTLSAAGWTFEPIPGC